MRGGSITFIVVLCALSPYTLSGDHCFRAHLREAISLNEIRRAQYAALAMDDLPERDLSDQSKAVSDLLIRIEKKGVLASYLPIWLWKGINFDRAARKYQEAGIPIVCEDFVPMKETPNIQPYHRPFPILENRYRGRVGYNFNDDELGSFESVAEVLEQEIERLSVEPRFNCMLRHVLESALRIVNHAPIYIDMAKKKGLSSPERLLWKMIRVHFWAMEDVMEIDRLAAPLQARGIPIVCNDVPPIPPYSERLLEMYEGIGGTHD